MTAGGRPGELGIGDRVRFGGQDLTVIGVSGPVVCLADTGGRVVTASVAGLLSAEDFAVLDARPRPVVPQVSRLDDLPAEVVEQARWWQRHIVEVLRGVPPAAGEGTVPRPEYDPAVFSLTRREQAKAAELTAAGCPVTASAIAKRRRRYQEQGLLGMIDGRAGKQMTPHGRAGDTVVAAMRQAISEATDESTRTAVFVFRRTRQILAEAGGEPTAMPSRRTLYRLFGRLQAGRHTTGSAKTRRSLAARPGGPFGQVAVSAPGDLMQIDSTPLDVLVRLDDGVTGRVDLTGIIDVATRTVTAAVLRPTTRSVDASVLLARTVTPEPMRPGWPEAMKMSESALPFRRMLSIDERLEHAAARPVIIPQVIVVDHGKVFVSESFKASCAFLGISFQPARKATGTDKPHIERTLGSVATMFAQYVSGYTGRSPEYRGRGTEDKAVWSLPELQDLLDQWIIAEWQNRPHDGLRDPLHPGRAFTPNQKYAALTETAGYVPLALSPDDHVELLPATWRAVNAYGIKISRRIYDGAELNPLRMQDSGVTARKGLWEIHCDPYDISRIWVRDHWNGGWITVFWTQLHRVAAPFGELAWDHARKLLPAATEAELADAVDDLLTRAGQGPGDSSAPGSGLSRQDRRVAARTRAVQPAAQPGPGPGPQEIPADGEPDDQTASDAAIVPMPIFDPFREAEKWR